MSTLPPPPPPPPPSGPPPVPKRPGDPEPPSSGVSLLEAQAEMEGFYVPNSRAQRNRNPLNLNYEPWLNEEFGALLEIPLKGETARFADFKTVQDGFNAASACYLRKGYIGLTLANALRRWAPGADGNDTAAYLKFVIEKTGLSADTVITADLVQPPQVGVH